MMNKRPARKRGAAASSSRDTTTLGGSPDLSVDDKVNAERVRLSRDLHDWLLQSLTGVALDLQSLHKLLDTDPQEVKDRLLRIQEAVATEQRELRAYIEDLQLVRPLNDELPTLGERLTGLASRFREQWDLKVDLDFDPVVHLAPEETQSEIYALVAEAVANAAKHSEGSEVVVAVNREDAAVHVKIEDNGKGFQFLGRYTLEQLVQLKRGPVTLKERIQSLGGDMVVSSTTGGVVVNALLPVRRWAVEQDSTTDR